MFYQQLGSGMECRSLVDVSQTEKERKRPETRNQEIDGMFLSLYTDKVRHPDRAINDNIYLLKICMSAMFFDINKRSKIINKNIQHYELLIIV